MRRLLLLALALTACPVGPNYVRPELGAKQGFKEAGDWKPAVPGDQLPRGSWWHLFGEAELDALVDGVNVSNQSLKVAEAQYREAVAAVGIARAPLFPTVNTSTNVNVAHGVSPVAAASGTAVPVMGGGTNTSFSLPLTLAWEIDVWGRMRRAVEAAQDNVEASAEDLESARLSAQATLAESYLQLQTLDADRALLEHAVQDLEKSLELTKNRYASGVAQRTDVLQAQAMLDATRAQAIEVQVARAQAEHAIAVLIGQTPATFSLSPRPLTAQPPDVPLALPSELLERRPDVAAAERRMAAANAEVGVAIAAWFPHFTLNASTGLLASNLANLFSAPSWFWSFGPQLSQTIMQGGLRIAQVDQARATYDAAVATYRQTALTAFQDVEDNLAALRVLEQEQKAQDAAADAAKQVVELTMNQYTAGTAQYLDVLVAQNTAITDERLSVDVRGKRMVASVLLIKALGGAWRGDAAR
jgi:NodT family efflux transporter outer membrane factor (OMF) lipoprotein